MTLSKFGRNHVIPLGLVLAFCVSTSVGHSAQAGDRLAEDLSSEQGRIVLAALKSVERMGHSGQSYASGVVRILKEHKTYPEQDYGLDNVIYPEAFKTLKAIGVKSDEALNVSMDYFRKAPDPLNVQASALALIATYGQKAAPIAPDLAKLLTDGKRHPFSARQMISVLIGIGPAAKKAVPALIQVATTGSSGDGISAFSALNEIDPKDRQVLLAYADRARKRPRNSEEQKVFELFSGYLGKYDSFSTEDLHALAVYLKAVTDADAHEVNARTGHLISVNPAFLSVARLFLKYPGSSQLIMSSLAARIRQLDVEGREFRVLLELAGDFGNHAAPLVDAVYDRASSRERIMAGYLKPTAIEVLRKIGTSKALEKARVLSTLR